jgi:hypothetical protein
MNEDRKLAEAQYFLGRMVELQNSREEFVFNLSAFLVAARTVVQYAYEEAKSNPKGQSWHKAAVKRQPSIKFFRDKRNVNIHVEPVEPQTAIGVELAEPIAFGEMLQVQLFQEGMPVGGTRIEAPAKAVGPSPPPVIRLHYRFADWSGSEDVMRMSLYSGEPIWRRSGPSWLKGRPRDF